MNTKRNLMKWIGVVMLTALSVFGLVGTVAAVPGIPLPAGREPVNTTPIHLYSNSRVRFEQYLAASQPQTYEVAGLPANIINDSWLRFKVYLEHSQ